MKKKVFRRTDRQVHVLSCAFAAKNMTLVLIYAPLADQYGVDSDRLKNVIVFKELKQNLPNL